MSGFQVGIVVKSRAVEWLCACLGARLDLASLRGARRADSRLACRAIIYSDDIKVKGCKFVASLYLDVSDMRKPPQEQCRQDEQCRQ